VHTLYTALGQISSQTDATGREVSYGYDDMGNLTSVSSPHENRYTTTTYDFHNQPIETCEITTEGQFILRASYDLLGRKISSTDRYGNSTQYYYDAFHRLKKVIHPEVLNENNQPTHPTFSYTYDLFGNVLAIEDPQGFITSKSYNLRGDPTKISF
jgi:YD repeat-containing protein